MIITQQSVFDVIAVTPSDTVDLTRGNCKGIYFGGAAAADVAIMTQGGQSVVLKNLAPGQIHQFAARRVLSTGTTATDILALY